MKILYIILVLLVSIEILQAQVSQEWASRYNGPGNFHDGARSIAVDDSGNVYVTGTSTGSAGHQDYVTIKYNSSGIQQWLQSYNGSGNSFDRAFSIAVDDSGNVYVTGESNGYGTGQDYATIKYNSSGDSVWVQRYNGPGNGYDVAKSLVVDDSGNVYVTGFSANIGLVTDFATIKYNSTGDSVWVQRYSSAVGNSIAVDVLGNVYVTGQYSLTGTPTYYATIKYNSSGFQQWVQLYGGPTFSDNMAKSIAVDNAGNVYVTGYSITISHDYATIKYNSSGDSVWVKRYNGPGNYVDEANSIAVDVSGNVFVTGFSNGIGSDDYATIKYNSTGVQQWVKRYNGPGNSQDEARSIVVDSLGNSYVTGYSYYNGINSDYATIKYDSSGVQQWVQRYNGPGNYLDEAFSIKVDNLGNVYVTGSSYGTDGNSDYATIKYSQVSGIFQISSFVSEHFGLSQNYPNPFNPTTNIEFSLPERSFVKLKVFDINGKEVAELVNENLSAGKFWYELNAVSLSSGIYFYTLETEKITETKKMVVLK